MTATTDKLVQRSAQEGNAASSMIEEPVPQASTSSQTSAQATEPAPGAPVAWPDAPAPVAWPDAPPAADAIKAQETIAVPAGAPADSVSDDTERTARGGKPTNNAGTPMIIFPILALGLTVVGTLSMKIAAARRARTIIDHPEPNRVDDQRQQEWRGDQDQRRSVDEGREYQSLISVVSDYSPFRSEGGAYQITREISKRRDKLAQLHQDLDRLLQAPTTA